MSKEDDRPERRQALAALVRRERARAGLSVSTAVARAAEDPETKISRTRWTQIESGGPPLASPMIIGKVAKVLRIDASVLMVAAGYDGPPITITADGRVDVTQLVTEIGEELRAIRRAIERLTPPDEP
jgi:hypothetical protein